MTKMKRLAQVDDPLVSITVPLSEATIKKRIQLYDELTPKQFKSRFSRDIYLPVQFELYGETHSIQVNHCANSFCTNFGEEQAKYKGKAKKYHLSGKDAEKVLICGKDNRGLNGIPSLGCTTRTMSNWSVAAEIERLYRINTVLPVDLTYTFHKEDCSIETTPFSQPKDFYKRGTSTSKSQRYQCKECEKFTNVLPDKKRNTGYHQKRNDILLQLAKHLINRVPLSRTCELLGIGRGTYYAKLEWYIEVAWNF